MTWYKWRECKPKTRFLFSASSLSLTRSERVPPFGQLIYTVHKRNICKLIGQIFYFLASSRNAQCVPNVRTLRNRGHKLPCNIPPACFGQFNKKQCAIRMAQKNFVRKQGKEEPCIKCQNACTKCITWQQRPLKLNLYCSTPLKFSHSTPAN